MPCDVHMHTHLAHPIVAPHGTDVHPTRTQHAVRPAAPAPDDGSTRPYDGGR
jgi:hypothetical protein